MEPIQTFQIETGSTSRAEDGAFRALADVARLTELHPDTRIVGGQMVMLLLHAFPVLDAIGRFTQDADTGISPKIAASGAAHDFLIGAGYHAENSNRYVREGQEIDLLVPSGTEHFGQLEHGGRAFDAGPGLELVIGGPFFEIQVATLLLDNSSLKFSIRVPTVELALILKSYALTSRWKAKDLADIYDLLLIARSNSHDDIGGWKIGRLPRRATRKDAVERLFETRKLRPKSRIVAESGVPIGSLLAMIREAIPKEQYLGEASS